MPYPKPQVPIRNAQSALANALIHAWEFESYDARTGAGQVRDIAGANNMTVTERTTTDMAYASGLYGNQLYMNRFHRATAAVPTYNYIASSYFTIELLLNVTDITTTPSPQIGFFWQAIAANNASALEFSINGTDWYWGVRDNSAGYTFPFAAGATVPINLHSVLTVERSLCSMYLQGQLVNTQTLPTTIFQGALGPVGLGSASVSGGASYENHAGFSSIMARIYNRPLTAQEVGLLYYNPWTPTTYVAPSQLYYPYAPPPAGSIVPIVVAQARLRRFG